MALPLVGSRWWWSKLQIDRHTHLATKLPSSILLALEYILLADTCRVRFKHIEYSLKVAAHHCGDLSPNETKQSHIERENQNS
jgi:hypothetical protein